MDATLSVFVTSRVVPLPQEDKRRELLALERELNESLSREGSRITKQEEFKKQVSGKRDHRKYMRLAVSNASSVLFNVS